MIVTIVVLYMFLRFHLEMEEEQLYRYMIILCIVNLIPVLIYTAVAYVSNTVDGVVLVWMTLL